MCNDDGGGGATGKVGVVVGDRYGRRMSPSRHVDGQPVTDSRIGSNSENERTLLEEGTGCTRSKGTKEVQRHV